jgi:predicted permease
VVLLSSALLMIRSFYERQRFDAGFQPEGALLARLTLTGERYRDTKARATFLDECVRRVHTLPGVESAAALTALPFSDEFGGGWSPDALDVDGTAVPEAARPSVLAHATTAQGLAALGIAVREGRDFQESEVAAGADVAVISEEVAERGWPGQDPLGRRIRLGAGEWLRVIGVAREVREPTSILGLDLKPHGQVYVPYVRRPSATVMLVLRGRDPGALAGALRREVRSLDPHLPLYDTRTLVEARRTADWVARLWGQMLAWAAAIGTFLACVGVYGVVSRSVARRTSEIGVRMAMGADRRAVLGLVLGQGLRLSLAGIGVGFLAALVLTRALASLLYGVSTADPFSLLGSSLALGGVAVAATYFPARRATGVNPIVALRSD